MPLERRGSTVFGDPKLSFCSDCGEYGSKLLFPSASLEGICKKRFPGGALVRYLEGVPTGGTSRLDRAVGSRKRGDGDSCGLCMEFDFCEALGVWISSRDAYRSLEVLC